MLHTRNADTKCIRITDTEGVRNGISVSVLPQLRLLLCRCYSQVASIVRHPIELQTRVLKPTKKLETLTSQ